MDENIFEAAGRQSKSSKDQNLRSKGERDALKKSNSALSDAEINGMLEKMRGMKEDLENQLSNVYQKGRESRIDVSSLIDKATKETNNQLDKMKEQERLLQEKIKSITPPETCLKKNPKSKEKLTQERKGKLRGARNNWIPVK